MPSIDTIENAIHTSIQPRASEWVKGLACLDEVLALTNSAATCADHPQLTVFSSARAISVFLASD